MSPKSLREFINQDIDEQNCPLSEASFLSKTFALSQLAKFKSVFQKLKSQSSKVRSLTTKVQSHEELEKKIDSLAEAIEELSVQVQMQATLTLHIQNTVVADKLLSANLNKLLKQNRRRL